MRFYFNRGPNPYFCASYLGRCVCVFFPLILNIRHNTTLKKFLIRKKKLIVIFIVKSGIQGAFGKRGLEELIPSLFKEPLLLESLKWEMNKNVIKLQTELFQLFIYDKKSIDCCMWS